MNSTGMTNQPAGGAADLTIRSGLPPLEELPWGWTWVLWVLAVLALAGVVFWLYRWWRRRSEPGLQGVTSEPPHRKALRRLNRALDFLPDAKPFCIAVSDALRIYLEERFHLQAPERTTEEFLVELSRTDVLDPEQRGSLQEFLTRCDLVKFARANPTRSELEALHAAAVSLVEETREIAEGPPAEAGTASVPA